MRTARNPILACVTAMLLMAATFAGAAETPVTTPPASPFDEKDAEIVALKKLDWKSVDVTKLDLKSRCVSLVVLNKILDMVGSKAALREDLLMTYIEQNNLADEYAKAMPSADNQAHLSYEQSQQVAAAALKTPRVAAEFGDDMDGIDPAMLNNYFTMYTKTCTRNWAEVMEARCAVRSMAKFLESKQMLPAFGKWADQEMDRRQKLHEEDLQKKQAAYVQTEAENQRKREEIAKKNKEESAINAAAYAAYKASQAENMIPPTRAYTESGGWSDAGDYGIWNTGYYSNAYWAGGAYRTGVRDRYTNGRWSRPSSRRAR